MTAERAAPALGVGVLGPLVLRVEGRPVEVPGSRRRALLALLALHAGRTVSTDRLVEWLWADDVPGNAAAALHSHLSRLRSHLGPLADRLQRHGSGYRLRLEPGELDVDRVRRLAAEAGAPGTGAARRAQLYRTALGLWRGSALEEFRALPALEAESVGLDELHLRLVDELLEARLALGDGSVAVDATAAAAAAPLRERTTLLLVRALAAEGRSADAMAAAQGYRRRLVAETGLDPGPALAELEQTVAAGTLATHPEVPVAAQRATTRPVARPDGPLVGRGHDREELLRLLGTHAAVTVTGPGGVGKTRLALDLAADLSGAPTSEPSRVPAGSPDRPGVPAEVAVVELAAVDRVDRLCQAVASTLGLRASGDVGAEDVARALVGRSLLLLLDNCEHLVEGCRALVVTLRRHAPQVRVLATSRTTLNVPGEYVVRLQPLPVPWDTGDLEALRRQPGVRAFLEHARRRRPGFDLAASDADDVVEVLRRLDGLPLGIELAARQVAVMPLSAVRARLDRALDLATGRAGPDDERQRTLRATIDSSYRLLTEPDRRMLCAIAPFPGGVDLATVEALADALDLAEDPLDVLHRLVDASLLVVDAPAARYRLLFTVRAFLLDALEADGVLAAAEERFLDRTLAVAAEIEAAGAGPGEPEADRRLRVELDNLRAARDVAVHHRRHDVRVGITVALADIATMRDVRELWDWALELAADTTLGGHPSRPAVLGCAAEAARLLGDLDRAARLADEAVAVAGPDPDPFLVHRAYVALGSVAHFRGDFEAARAFWLRSGEGRPYPSGAWLGSAALAAAYGGDPSEARLLLDRAHESNAVSGCLSHGAFAAYVEGELRAAEGAVAQAVPFYESAIATARRSGGTFVEGVAAVALASARTRIGDTGGAADAFGRLLDSWWRSGHSTQLWTTARNAAALLAGAGRQRTAALLLVCADEQPGAAAVNATIARHSGRVFVPLHEVVDDHEREELQAEAHRLGPWAVLDLARRELEELSREAR